MKRVHFPLMGFAGRTIYQVGALHLSVVLGGGWKMIRTEIVFIVVDAPNSYNVILGQTTFNPHKIAVSPCHQKMKFPTLHGIGEVNGSTYVKALIRQYS